MRNYLLFFIIPILFICLGSCNNEKKPTKLPYIGHTQIVDGDTLRHKIPPFGFVNQDSVMVTNATFQDHIYISDFFFISCPSICPKVKKQMLRIYEEFADEPLLKFASFTIDPKRDDVAALNTYAHNLDIDNKRWHFLTGDKDLIYDLADEFFVVVKEDSEAPGGFDHSGKLILVDKAGHVRAFAEGTDADDVTKFFDEISMLIDEYKK